MPISVPWLDSALSTAVATRSSGVTTDARLSFVVFSLEFSRCLWTTADVSLAFVRPPAIAATAIVWLAIKPTIKDRAYPIKQFLAHRNIDCASSPHRHAAAYCAGASISADHLILLSGFS
jgi:hypothetical protein